MLKNHVQSVKDQFSKGAEYYDGAANIQKKVAARLISHIGVNLDPTSILEAGCGTGHLTTILAQLFPESRIDAFDLSPKMISYARQRLAKYSNIYWEVADTTSFQSETKYSAIISSSSLHWLPSMKTGIENLVHKLAPQGEFLFSIMVQGTFKELQDSRFRVSPDNKPVRDLLPAKKVLDIVEGCGLHIQEAFEEEFTAHYKSVKSFLVDIHRQGLTGGDFSSSGTPLSPKEINRIIVDYKKHNSDSEGNVHSTYKVLFVKAKR